MLVIRHGVENHASRENSHEIWFEFEVEDMYKSLELRIYDLGVGNLTCLGVNEMRAASRFLAMRARIVSKDTRRG